MTLNELYELRRNTPHNINEHMDVLASYALHVKHIVEIGTDIGFSTTAFLIGLSKGTNNLLDCYDINRTDAVPLLQSMAADNEVYMSFCLGDSKYADIPECDLMFIDSEHTEEQLRAELFTHANKAQQYLILHDTESFPDMLIALYDFIDANPHWELERHYRHQHGLTIYKRNKNWKTNSKALPTS